MPLSIDKAHACRYLLTYQGLRPPRVARGKPGILDFVQKAGCIQYDPLDIVGKNPELVLQSRVDGFKRRDLQELLYTERKLIDGWDKMMSIYPTEDWPFFAVSRERNFRQYSDPSRPANRIVPQVRDALEKRGPLSSIDLEFDEQIDWHWAPTRAARAALESMYFWGELVVHHKVHTRKLYDLAARHLPQEILESPNPFPTHSAYLDWHIFRRISGIGMLWDRSGGGLLAIHGLTASGRKESMLRLADSRRIVEVTIDGTNQTFYMPTHDRAREAMELAAEKKGPAARAAIIAPLDNLLWDRKMIAEVFGFSYVWEVYKPEKERLFGYYVLPVLYGDRFVGRFEPGRDSETGHIQVKNWWWEPEVRQTKSLRKAIATAMRSLTRLNKAPGIVVLPVAEKNAGVGWLTSP